MPATAHAPTTIHTATRCSAAPPVERASAAEPLREGAGRGVAVCAAAVVWDRKSHIYDGVVNRKNVRTEDTVAGSETILRSAMTAPLLIVENDVQDDEEGAGCGGGVAGSPWWKVDSP
jgi:hypothetical protein